MPRSTQPIRLPAGTLERPTNGHLEHPRHLRRLGKHTRSVRSADGTVRDVGAAVKSETWFAGDLDCVTVEIRDDGETVIWQTLRRRDRLSTPRQAHRERHSRVSAERTEVVEPLGIEPRSATVPQADFDAASNQPGPKN